MSEELMVFVTVPSRDDGERIAEAVVGERLAACVNILGAIRSIYRWQGEVARDDEHLLLIKTTRARYPELESRIKELHTYEVPEVIAVSLERGSAEYLNWLSAALDDDA